MSMFPNRRWLVIPASEVENIDFNQVLESSADTLRYSVDGSQTFIKYEVKIIEEDQTLSYVNAETGEESTITIPAGVYGRPSIYQDGMTEYTHAEILEILSGEEWTINKNL